MENLISILSDCSIVAEHKVLKFERTKTTRRFKISIDLIDGSSLIINESTNPHGFRYAYHWQDAQNRLLARWDNAPYHPTLPTFPDHFHFKDELKPAAQPMLREVFDFISKNLKK